MVINNMKLSTCKNFILVAFLLISLCSVLVHSQKNAQEEAKKIPQPLVDLIQKLSLEQRKNLVHILMDSMTLKEDAFRNDWNCPDLCRGYNGRCMKGCTVATVSNYDCADTCRDYHGKCMDGCVSDYNPWICPQTCRGYNGKCMPGCV